MILQKDHIFCEIHGTITYTKMCIIVKCKIIDAIIKTKCAEEVMIAENYCEVYTAKNDDNKPGSEILSL